MKRKEREHNVKDFLEKNKTQAYTASEVASALKDNRKLIKGALHALVKLGQLTSVHRESGPTYYHAIVVIVEVKEDHRGESSASQITGKEEPKENIIETSGPATQQ